VRIQYLCKYCKHLVGEINQPSWTPEEAERLCGFHALSAVERSEHIAYHRDSDMTYVQTVCDYCQSALETHPELLVEGKLLQ
jgi:hypothetical protein